MIPVNVTDRTPALDDYGPELAGGPPLRWYPGASGHAGGEQAGLHDGCRAEIGPDGLHASRGLHVTWSVLRDGEEIAGGYAADAAGARAAVASWADADLMVTEITRELLSAAFTRFGVTRKAFAAAGIAIAASRSFASPAASAPATRAALAAARRIPPARRYL
jgi:hypothetical protein